MDDDLDAAGRDLLDGLGGVREDRRVAGERIGHGGEQHEVRRVGRRQRHRDERVAARSWLSRIPAPSKPAVSTFWISLISSGIGAVPGIRSET
jgi:hypothetical protein